MPTPLWSKVLNQLSLNAYRAYRLQEIVRNELLYAYLPPSARNEMTIQAYSTGSIGYAERRYNREKGLSVWEKELLEASPCPPPGRVALMAAGGGREMVALNQRGYSVTAFEPSPALRRAAENLASELSGATVHDASYADLVAFAEGKASTVLERLDLSADLVWLGWGSFTHLTEPSEQLAVLRAIRHIWPAAPVALSFFLLGPNFENPAAPSVRVRSALRATFQKLGGAVPPAGLYFNTQEGFSYSFDKAEVERLFAEAGYRAEVFREEPFPNALLLPR
jgi:hypothetical protein